MKKLLSVFLVIFTIIINGCSQNVSNISGLPDKLKGIENLREWTVVEDPQIQSQIMNFLEADKEYQLLADYMKKNYSYSISDKDYTKTFADNIQYIGIAPGAIYKNESSNLPVAIFVALFPMDYLQGSVNQDKNKLYYIEEHTEKGLSTIYVENNELKKI